MDSKINLRNIAKEVRKTLDIDAVSRAAVEQIRALSSYKDAKNVMIFYPKKYEVNLLELLNDDKNFYLPKVCGENLKVCPYTDKLEISEFNVCEPCSNPIDAEILDLVIVPALMADEDNYRLGYGGGFYDRFLAKYSDIPTVLPISEKLCVNKLPHDEFDIKIDTIIKC